MPTISLEPERATLATCESLHAQFAEALSRGDDLMVDLSQTSELDLTGLQILLAAARAAQAAGASLTLAGGLSPAATTAFARAGLDPNVLVRPRLATEPLP
jgi:anti-anti-sigma regulatory factor